MTTGLGNVTIERNGFPICLEDIWELNVARRCHQKLDQQPQPRLMRITIYLVHSIFHTSLWREFKVCFVLCCQWNQMKSNVTHFEVSLCLNFVDGFTCVDAMDEEPRPGPHEFIKVFKSYPKCYYVFPACSVLQKELYSQVEIEE